MALGNVSFGTGSSGYSGSEVDISGVTQLANQAMQVASSANETADAAKTLAAGLAVNFNSMEGTLTSLSTEVADVKKIANTANTNALSAQSVANNALQVANEAKETADEALKKADGGLVVMSDTEPGEVS